MNRRDTFALRLAVWAGPLQRQVAAACNVMLFQPFSTEPHACPFEFADAVEATQVIVAEVVGRTDSADLIRAGAAGPPGQSPT